MNNYDQVGTLAEVAADSTGSASKRMEIYLDSVEAKTNELKATWEELVMSLNQSESYKDLLDMLIWAIEHLPSVIGYITALVTLFKGQTIVKGIRSFTEEFTGLFSKIKNLPAALETVRKNIVRLDNGAVKFAKTEEKMAAAADVAAAKMAILQLAIGAVVAVISLGIQAYTDWKRKQVEIANSATEEAEKHQETISTLEEVIEKYKGIYNSTDDYNTKQENLKSLSKDLTTAYGKEADALDLLNGKYKENIQKMEEKINKERKLQLGQLKVAADAGMSNLNNQTNIFGATSIDVDENKGEALSVTENAKFITDVRNIMNSVEEGIGYFSDFWGNPDRYDTLVVSGGATNQQSLKLAQDFQEYIDSNVDTLSQKEINFLSKMIEELRKNVDENAEEQFKDLQDYQLAKVTENDDGSLKQEIIDYEDNLKKQQELETEYNNETNKKRKENLKEQLAEQYQLTKDSLEKIKALYNKDDIDQTTLSENILLDYLGVSEDSTSGAKNNIYSYLSDKQRQEYLKIKKDAEETNQLSDNSIKKLQTMRDSLSGEEKENFIQALNDDLDEFDYKIKAARLELEKTKLSSEYANVTENGQWKSEDDATKFKNTVRNNLGSYGINTQSETYQQAESLLDGTQEGLDKFYEKIKDLIDEVDKNREEYARQRERLQTKDAEHTYGEGIVGTGSSSSFKTYLDDIKDVQAIRDKISDGKVADYSDVEKLRSKTSAAAEKMNKKIEAERKSNSRYFTRIY